nr:hypothetical protein [uncultured Acetatifactor sp.]
MLDRTAPELMANPMIEYAKRMTLAEGISSTPDIRAVYEVVLQALNEQGESAPGLLLGSRSWLMSDSQLRRQLP